VGNPRLALGLLLGRRQHADVEHPLALAEAPAAVFAHELVDVTADADLRLAIDLVDRQPDALPGGPVPVEFDLRRVEDVSVASPALGRTTEHLARGLLDLLRAVALHHWA